MIARAEAAWLAPAPAARLAVIRVALGALLVWTVFMGWNEVPRLGADPSARYLPVGAARLFAEPPSTGALQALQVALVGLGALWIAGAAWRVTAPLFAAGFLFWASWRLSWGAISHGLHLATLHTLLLACLPAAAVLSVDARVRTPLAWPAPPVSWRHGWGLRLLGVATACVYLLAGVAKVEVAGAGWADGGNLLAQVAYSALVRAVYEPDAGQPAALVLLRDHGWLLSAGAVLTLVVELGAPLALLHRWLGVTWALATFGMHLGIALLMGITFPYQTWGLAFLSFLPVERLLPARWRG